MKELMNAISYTLAAVLFAVGVLTDQLQLATAFAVLMVVLQLQRIEGLLEKHFKDTE